MSLEIIEEYRGISVATLEDCGVRWEEGDDYAVRIPYRNYLGEWYERRLLDPRLPSTGRPKVLSPTNAERHLYNPLRLGPNAGFIIFAEGEYDTLSLIDAGYPAVGTQGTKTFRELWARLFEGAVCIIAFDGDQPGIEASHQLKRALGNLGNQAYVMELPEDEDLNDLHQQGLLADQIELFMEQHEVVI